MMRFHATKKILGALLALALWASLPSAGHAALGAITGVSRDGDKLTLFVGQDVVEIEIILPHAARVNYRPLDVSSPDTPVTGDMQWAPVGASIDTGGDPITLSTAEMSIRVTRNPLRLSVYGAGGVILLQEPLGGGIGASGLSLGHGSGQNFYGISNYTAFESSSDLILRNHGAEIKAGEQGHTGGPFVWSTSGYGLLVDSDGGRFDVSDGLVEFSGNSKSDLEFYVFLGAPRKIHEAMFEVTGRPPMLPKSALGFMNSEWGITETELKQIVERYRYKRIPLDSYALDFDWKAWGQDDYGEFRWNTGNFPGGSGGQLKNYLDSKGVKLMGITKPRIHVYTAQGQSATQSDLWVDGQLPYLDYFSLGWVKDLDFRKPAARQWFFEHSKDAFDTGIVSWWHDEADGTGWDGGEGFSNFQNLHMQQAMYEGQRGYVNQRAWSLNRVFYLGAQRYAYTSWSGDITAHLVFAQQRYVGGHPAVRQKRCDRSHSRRRKLRGRDSA